MIVRQIGIRRHCRQPVLSKLGWSFAGLFSFYQGIWMKNTWRCRFRLFMDSAKYTSSTKFYYTSHWYFVMFILLILFDFNYVDLLLSDYRVFKALLLKARQSINYYRDDMAMNTLLSLNSPNRRHWKINIGLYVTKYNLTRIIISEIYIYRLQYFIDRVRIYF